MMKRVINLSFAALANKCTQRPKPLELGPFTVIETLSHC